MDKRPIAIAIVISTASLTVGAGALLFARHTATAAASAGGEKASCGMPLAASAATKLPKGTTLLASTEQEFIGKAICGHCAWGIGDGCNVVLWNKEKKHAVFLMPSEKLTELTKLTGTCPNGRSTVTAKGSVTTFRAMNYLLVSDFTFNEAPKPLAQSETEKLIDQASDAFFKNKDLEGAMALAERALPSVDQPDVQPMFKYKLYAGLASMYVEKKDLASAKKYFAFSVAPAEQVTDNKRPLAYSLYNLACAEAELGEGDQALKNLRSALKVEAQTERRRYVALAQADGCFSKLQQHSEFAQLITEFSGNN